MYLGYVMEQGTTDEIFNPPYHPYTEALLSAVPIADPRYSKRRVVLEGDIPSATNPPPGCPFQTRCPRKGQVPGGLCEKELPPLRNMGNDHLIRCHLDQSVFDSMAPVIALTEDLVN
jgi:peptide/nickel transport system ATP-binding protein